MGVTFLNRGFRFREYARELVLTRRVCKEFKIPSVQSDFDVLLWKRSKLNACNFKSEIKFIEFINTYYENDFDNLVLYRNFPVSCLYFGDFVSKKYRFIIEIDGKSHRNGKQQRYDKRRDFRLNQCGYEVLRVKHNKSSFHNAIPRLKELIAFGPGRTDILDSIDNDDVSKVIKRISYTKKQIEKKAIKEEQQRLYCSPDIKKITKTTTKTFIIRSSKGIIKKRMEKPIIP